MRIEDADASRWSLIKDRPQGADQVGPRSHVGGVAVCGELSRSERTSTAEHEGKAAQTQGRREPPHGEVGANGCHGGDAQAAEDDHLAVPKAESSRKALNEEIGERGSWPRDNPADEHPARRGQEVADLVLHEGGDLPVTQAP